MWEPISEVQVTLWGVQHLEIPYAYEVRGRSIAGLKSAIRPGSRTVRSAASRFKRHHCPEDQDAAAGNLAHVEVDRLECLQQQQRAARRQQRTHQCGFRQARYRCER